MKETEMNIISNSDHINVALNKRASQSSVSRWSKPEGPSAAVNGKKNGEFSFCTALEQDPWWGVDLEKTYPLSSIVVFNRGKKGSALADRAKSMVALVSIDGVQWEKVYSGGSSFGGVLDGCPITINCLGKKARYVKLQLEEKNYLHLDEVEVFSASEKSANDRKNPAKTARSKSRSRK